MIMRSTISRDKSVLTEGVCMLILFFHIWNNAVDFALLNSVHPSLCVLEEALPG